MQVIPNTNRDRRDFFRVYLRESLCGILQMLHMDGKAQWGQKIPVCIKDIGPGGVGFSSSMMLPTGKDVLYRVETMVCNKTVVATGYIVRKEESATRSFYGFKLDVAENERSKYVALMNRLLVQQHRRKTLKGCSVCDEECSVKKMEEILETDEHLPVS